MSDNHCNAAKTGENTCNVDDLRALKQLFVKKAIDNHRKCDPEIETICAVSPDAAITRLQQETDSITAQLSLLAQATSAMRQLADCLDADGSFRRWIEDDYDWLQEQAAALETMKRFAARRNSPLSREAEEEKNAALQVLVSMRNRKDEGATAAVKQETKAPLDDIPY